MQPSRSIDLRDARQAPEHALGALAEPHRRDIVRLLGQTPLTADEIASRFNMSRRAVAPHLRRLKEVGLLTVRRRGTRHTYAVETEGLAALRRYLDGLLLEAA